MDVVELGGYLRAHFVEHPEPAGRTAFRLETLDLYDVNSNGDDVERYVAGEPEPSARSMPWLAQFRAEKKRGLYRSRVHVLTPPLTDYLRFECEWGYVFNVEAGEDVQILDTSETPLEPEVAALFADTRDFWMINDDLVVQMHYDDGGRFVGAEEVTGDRNVYYSAARAARERAVAFTPWWNRHPEHHRAA
jgi:hypothetical protein